MKVARLSALRTGRLYPPGIIPGTHFCYRLSRPQGHSAAGRITSMINSNDPIENRTRDLPSCSILPQQNAPHLTRGKQHNCHAVHNFPNLFDLRKNGLWFCNRASKPLDFSCTSHSYQREAGVGWSPFFSNLHTHSSLACTITFAVATTADTILWPRKAVQLVDRLSNSFHLPEKTSAHRTNPWDRREWAL
jgi:hypothetical protein